MPTRMEFERACLQLGEAIEHARCAGKFHGGQAVAVDFDKPIHNYGEGWQDGTIYDEPAPFAREAVEFLGHYWRVPIFTARANVEDAAAWLKRHGFPLLQVTNRKPAALAYIDDRAVRWQSWPQAVIDLAALLAPKEEKE